jgi:hypothetical protein
MVPVITNATFWEVYSMEYSISNILLIGNSVNERMDAVNAYIAENREKYTGKSVFNKVLKQMSPAMESKKLDAMTQLFGPMLYQQFAISHGPDDYSILVAEHFSWECILHEATSLAKTFHGAMLAIGTQMFGFLVLYIFNDGKLESSHMIGPRIEEDFDIVSTGDVLVFSRILGQNPADIDRILYQTEYTHQIDELSKMLGVNLVQDFDWIEDENPSDYQFEFL